MKRSGLGSPGKGGSISRAEPRFRARALLGTPSAELIRAAGFAGARARDFEDFVSGEDRPFTATRLPLPDPGFREGLRRRLWQLQVLARRIRAPHHH